MNQKTPIEYEDAEKADESIKKFHIGLTLLMLWVFLILCLLAMTNSQL